jgi:antitoxin CptB
MSVEPNDAAQHRRLLWRSRRGLLENDLVLSRFFEAYPAPLSDEQIAGLDELLEQTDNDLLDLILVRQELTEANSTPAARAVLIQLRQL